MTPVWATLIAVEVGGGTVGFVVCLEGGAGGSFDALDVGCERKRTVEDDMLDQL